MDAFDPLRASREALTDRSCDACGDADDGEFNSLQGRWLCPDCWDSEFAASYRVEAVPVRRAG